MPRHEALEGFTGFLLRKVSMASFARMAKISARHGLHPMHFGILMILDADGPISQTDLSARAGIDPSSMVARMDVLEHEGLIERERSAADRRSYEIQLSSKGRDVLAELRREAAEHGEQFFSPLSKAERKQLHGLLAKLAAGLEEAPSE